MTNPQIARLVTLMAKSNCITEFGAKKTPEQANL